MARDTELVLFVNAEAELDAGLALACRLAERSDYQGVVCVLADNPTNLLEQVRRRLQQLDAGQRFKTETLTTEIDNQFAFIKGRPSLRVLLIPGLDQLNDQRKLLLRRVHATVVCYEPHPGLAGTPSGLWLLGEDQRRAVHWFCDHLLPHPELGEVSLESLAAAAPNSDGQPGKPPQTAGDWILLSALDSEVDAAAKRAKAAIEAAVGPVILVRGEGSTRQWFFEQHLPALFARFVPQMTRENRQQLAADLTTFSKLDFEFTALICASTFLASFGLVQDSAAVIIGAMLVAPLMTPILGAGLSLAQGNRPLFTSSLRTIAIGFLAALLTSTLFGLLIRLVPNSILVHTEEGVVLTQEMWSRTSPTIIDFLVGLVGGSAAAFARTRGHLSAALAGAAIAAALVPPIATAGLQIAFASEPIATSAGEESANLIYGPMLLFLANMLTIMIGSSWVLWSCGVRSDHSHSRKEKWSTRMTVVLSTLTVIFAVWIVQHS